MPILTLVLLSAGYLHRMERGAAAARQQARRCALRYADGDCQRAALGDDPSLSECPAILGRARASAELTDQRQALSRAANADREGETLFERVESVPLLGSLVQGVFGTGQTATAEVAVTGAPRGTPGRVRRTHYVLCNEPGTSESDISSQIGDVFMSLLGD